MSADQEASFKAVLLDKDRMAFRVAAFWIEAQRPSLACPKSWKRPIGERLAASSNREPSN
jgi:hypothetical protein